MQIREGQTVGTLSDAERWHRPAREGPGPEGAVSRRGPQRRPRPTSPLLQQYSLLLSFFSNFPFIFPFSFLHLLTLFSEIWGTVQFPNELKTAAMKITLIVLFGKIESS